MELRCKVGWSVASSKWAAANLKTISDKDEWYEFSNAVLKFSFILVFQSIELQ